MNQELKNIDLNDIVLKEVIGRGAFGEIHSAIIENKEYAVKIMNIEANDDEIVNLIINELKTVVTLDHENIIKTHTYILNNYEKVYIIMELCKYGSLKNFITKHPITNLSILATITKQLLLGLKYMHENGYVHRDIKADNILVNDKGIIKLCDFGISNKIYDDVTHKKIYRHTFTGTLNWLSPEIANNEKYDEKTDIWSLGVTLLQLYNGKPPLCNLFGIKLLLKIAEGNLNINYDKYPEELSSFLKHCLCVDTKERYSCKDLLNHKFIKLADENILEYINSNSI